ncbi:DNA lyase-like protein [Phaeosphaeriaceae sp. PMI808]|nr:DNA lyase-like protein [Phaeosphaeriaceae sp. PMI808]
MVRITTWNVNGIRNPLAYKPWSDKKTYNAMFDILDADIVIMQELKIQRKDLTDDMVLVPGWDCYFSLPKHKKGYSGVGIYTRQSVCAPIRAEEGLLGVLYPPGSSTSYRELPEEARIGGYPTIDQIASLRGDPAVLDAEGRCLVIEFPAFVLFGVYSPANSNGLRDDFRHDFLTALDTRIRNLAKMGKNIIVTGDLNVSRDLIDTARAEDYLRSEGMTHDDYLSTPIRRIFNQLLMNGNVPGARDQGRDEPILYDLCREFHPTREGMYTHWEQKINARPGNFGSRIDFILCSITIKDWFKEADIQEGLAGSDHCPVYAVTKDKVLMNTGQLPGMRTTETREEIHIRDMMNPPGVFTKGLRQREYSPTKDVAPLSGRLLPEFTKRRNIRDMFNRRVGDAKSTSVSTPAIMEAGSQVKSVFSKIPTSNETVPNVDAKPTSVFTPTIMEAGSPSVFSKTPTPNETVPNVGASLANEHTGPKQSSLISPEKRRVPSTSPVIPVKRNKSSHSATGNSTTTLGKESTTSLSLPSTSSQEENDCQTGHSSSGHVQTDPLASQEASKEGWTKLFSKKPTPRCEGHAEPCMILTTRKPGVNCGRQFYMCSRPIGPSGQKENGTQWRCGTFIWASDWKG